MASVIDGRDARMCIHTSYHVKYVYIYSIYTHVEIHRYMLNLSTCKLKVRGALIERQDQRNHHVGMPGNIYDEQTKPQVSSAPQDLPSNRRVAVAILP